MLALGLFALENALELSHYFFEPLHALLIDFLSPLDLKGKDREAEEDE